MDTKISSVLRFFFKSELARFYNVSSETLRYWIKRNPYLSNLLDDYWAKYFTPKQTILIFKELGVPDRFEDINSCGFLPIKQYTKREITYFYRVDFQTLIIYLKKSLRHIQNRESFLKLLFLIENINSPRKTLFKHEVNFIFDVLGNPLAKIQKNPSKIQNSEIKFKKTGLNSELSKVAI